MARIILINHPFKGKRWYNLTLWVGHNKELNDFEKMIIYFLWVDTMDDV